jgi:glycosyltransferase involved in cell wall biosynthesis
VTRTALVIVPTFNERENLPVVAAALMRYPHVSLLVVDDQSPDGTGAVADALAREYPGRIDVMHRTALPGLGRSYVDAIASVLNRPVDVICQMDGDLSHDPQHLPDLIAGTEHADVVIGSRYVPGGKIVNWPRRRRILSRFANAYIRLVTRMSPRERLSLLAARRARVNSPWSTLVAGLLVSRRDAVRRDQSAFADRRGANHVRRTAPGRVEALRSGAG